MSIQRLPTRTVALVIATRGNSKTLLKTIAENLEGAVLDSTKVIVGLDEDDPGLEEAKTIVASFPDRANVKAAIGPRPGSIGAVYNRCTEQEPADIYIAGADDAIIRTPGWDERILEVTERMPGFIGVVGCGKMPVESMLPATCAVTRPLIDRMGYFLQPYTPFWWMDTWLFEISVMIGRMFPLEMEFDFGDWTNTRGMRDLTYWAQFFDDMRGERRAIAETIINDPAFKSDDAIKKQLLERMDMLCAKFLHSNSCLRDPAYADRIMKKFAHDAPEDERYIRIKARSADLVTRAHAAGAIETAAGAAPRA
jgi:hypothetical protein